MVSKLGCGLLYVKMVVRGYVGILEKLKTNVQDGVENWVVGYRMFIIEMVVCGGFFVNVEPL